MPIAWLSLSFSLACLFVCCVFVCLLRSSPGPPLRRGHGLPDASQHSSSGSGSLPSTLLPRLKSRRRCSDKSDNPKVATPHHIQGMKHHANTIGHPTLWSLRRGGWCRLDGWVFWLSCILWRHASGLCVVLGGSDAGRGAGGRGSAEDGGGGASFRKGGGVSRDALEGKGPQRQPQRRLDRRLEEVAKAVGGGYCQLQMPLSLALAPPSNASLRVRVECLFACSQLHPSVHLLSTPLPAFESQTVKLGGCSPSPVWDTEPKGPVSRSVTRQW